MPITHKPLNINLIENTLPYGKISYFDSIDSTNSWLLEHGQCGDICISEMQNSGRGRRGNIWISPKTGNIYFSLCWCFDERVEHWSLLGLVTGIATAEALSEIGLNGHGVKWPNDIFWQQQKLGGILIETQDQSGKVVIGIGLNINMPEDSTNQIDQAIISLDEAMRGITISRDQLVITLIRQLHQHLNSFTKLNFEDFIASWNAWDILRGKTVSFTHQRSKIVGKVADIDKHGRLGIINKTGELTFYSSADIKLGRL